MTTLNYLNLTVDKWDTIPWKKFRKIVFRLQVRIFKAQKAGKTSLVKKLQKLLLSSKAAKWLAILQVTQLNNGKKTPGVDGKLALTNIERVVLFIQLSNNWKNWKHKPLKRVYIPKADGSKRGLGIPTIADRAYQCLIKLALEPYAEAIFNHESYGFRPGRSTHDVQQRIFSNLNKNANGETKKILEIDIEKCFDRIDHKAIMDRLVLPKSAKDGIFSALKAGVKGEFFKSDLGTPQGGVISPLLANLVLHGLEHVGHDLRYRISNRKRGVEITALNGFRYADDVVYILNPGDDEKALRGLIEDFLSERGLKLKESKTRLVKSTEGFDFLGWHFKVKPNGRLTVIPSKKSIEEIKGKIKDCIKNHKLTIVKRIAKCRDIVRGWRLYHRHCYMRNHQLWDERLWTYKYLTKKTKLSRYQKTEALNKAFPAVSWRIGRFISVKRDATPFDGDLVDWSKRENSNYDGLTPKTIAKQSYKCKHCNLNFLPGDNVELHHIDGNHQNWKPKNLEALHRKCHHEKYNHGVNKRYERVKRR